MTVVSLVYVEQSKFAVPRQTLLVLLFSRKEVTQPRCLCNEPFVCVVRRQWHYFNFITPVSSSRVRKNHWAIQTDSHSCRKIIQFITIFYHRQWDIFAVATEGHSWIFKFAENRVKFNKVHAIDTYWNFIHNLATVTLSDRIDLKVTVPHNLFLLINRHVTWLIKMGIHMESTNQLEMCNVS